MMEIEAVSLVEAYGATVLDIDAMDEAPVGGASFRKHAKSGGDSSDHSAFDGLRKRNASDSLIFACANIHNRYFAAQFVLPSRCVVNNRLLNQGYKVCLKSFMVNRWHLSGTVGVLRGSSRLFVRYTLDNWGTFNDVNVTFLDADESIGVDRFHFRLDFPFRLPNDTKLQLAVACVSGEQTYWDNNDGVNYIFNYTSSGGKTIV